MKVIGPRRLAILGLLVIAGAACGSSPSAASKTYTIGIFEAATATVIDQIAQSFEDSLSKQGLTSGKNVTFIVKNAQGTVANDKVIADDLVSQKVDLVFCIGTSATQAMIRTGSKIPILFGASTAPVKNGFVTSLDHPGGNITGTTDLVDPKLYLSVVKQILPNAHTIGSVTNPANDSSANWQKSLVSEAQAEGYSVIQVPVSTSADIVPAVRSLVGRVDLIIAPPDDTVEQAIAIVAKTALDNKIPFVAPNATEAEKGALFALGVDYGQLGQINGQQAYSILVGGKKPGDIGVQGLNTPIIEINLTTARTLGLTIPQSLLSDPNVKTVGS